MAKEKMSIGQTFGRSGGAGDPMGGIQEAEWVYTGPDFAKSHPKGRLWIGEYLVALYVLGCGLVSCLGAYFSSLFYVIIVGLALLTLIAIFRRHPAAYPLVWGFLTLFALFHAICIPFALALAFYWADGERPNLIYRHRFQRLVPRG